ncbi:MAG TPA: hypothetical protein VNG13_08105 [Mycobacteriales bacterium]|nr:hypothetical protein [Mycobacteriales bacterium]
MTPSTLHPDPTALSPADRCDRCGARAYVRAVLPGGGELLFCAHHGRRFADRLREVALTLQDETGALTEAPSAN